MLRVRVPNIDHTEVLTVASAAWVAVTRLHAPRGPLATDAPTRSLKVDRGIPSDLSRVPDVASVLERQSHNGCWTGEHPSCLELHTGIAAAFARNPMAVANIGWDPQACFKGRFDGARPSFDGDSYSHTLMTPMLTTQQDVVAAMIEEVCVG